MSRVKAEVSLNLLNYFFWLAQSPETTLVSFSIAQKQHVKDSGRFSNSGNDSLCKQTSDEETRVVPRNRLLILQSLSFRNRPVGKTSVKTMFELSSYVALKISSPRQPVTHTHLSAVELITPCWHSHILKLPGITCADVLPACAYSVWSLRIETMKSG